MVNQRLLRGLATLFIMSATLLVAPGGQAQETESAQEPVAPTTERIENLIETLESETGRQEFIDDLKTLLEVQGQQQEEPASELTSALKVDELWRRWKRTYVAFLENNGLNASLVGYLTASAAIVMAALILLYVLKRLIYLARGRMVPLITRYHLNQRRIDVYISVWRFCGYAVVLVAAAGALAALWSLDVERWIPKHTQLLLVQALISLITVLALAAVIIEVADSAVQHFFRRRMAGHSARLNTLLPIARTVLMLTLFTLFGLTLLSQLGLNVMPLLAGAGVIGFAVGFGAQTLIKDVLTGFIVIVEDLIQVGDVASVGGKTGLVEKITIRKVQLRDLSGTVFTVPFSEVTIVENLTKDFSFYLLDVGVAYRENTDKVIELLKEIDEQMRADEAYRDKMLQPIEVLGVDRFADSAVIVRARLKTVPLQQWFIGREFNRRMKLLFDERGVEIPFPHRTLYFGEDKQGNAPPMRVDVPQLASANDVPPRSPS